MQTQKTRLWAGAALCGAVTLLSLASRPVIVAAFSTTGDNLSLTQRDFRVFNNFQDAAANDNTFPHPNFPATSGAVMAIAKAHAEWGSRPRGGDGLGDGVPSNPVLGSGGANFDNTYQGLASGPGGDNDNVHSAASLGGAIIVMTVTPAGDGWKIVYNDDFKWDDGPGAPIAGAIDLQGVATHEIGHTLGLGHSSVAGATMFNSIPGDATSSRSIAADDSAGLQAIYGVASSTKPVIAALGGPLDTGSTLVITGQNFSATGNEVWFTDQGGDGTPLKLLGVSSTAGGTQISVVIPDGASAGDVLVKAQGTSGSALSNAFPIDIDAPPGVFALTGPGLNGAAGVPQLTGSGDLSPGGTGFSLFVQLAPSGAGGFLFVSMNEANLPFHGGVFDPAPILLQVPLVAGADGKITLPAAIPAGPFSGLSLVTQAWFTSGSGVAGTNGLRLEVP